MTRIDISVIRIIRILPMNNKKIYLASDHAGFELKEKLEKYLLDSGFNVEDCGPHEFDAKDDYPDLIIPAAQKVANDLENSVGIVLGGSGQGEAFSANKVKGIRAAVFYGGDQSIVELSRTHNNANILSLGARFLSEDEAKKAVKLWLNTEFEGERHQTRIQKILDYELSQKSIKSVKS